MPEREDNNKRVIEVTPGGDVTMPEHHMRTEPRHQSPEKVQVAAKKPPSRVPSEPQQQSSWVRSEPRQQSSGEVKTMPEELVNHKSTIEITADGATKIPLNQVRSSEGIDAMPEREDNNKHVIEVTPGGDVTMPEHHMRTEPRHQSPEKVQVAAKKPPSGVRSEPQQQSSWVRSEPRQQSSGEVKTMREELVNHKSTIE